METHSSRMAAFAADLRYDRISPEAVSAARRFFLDSVGCAVGGLDTPDVRAMRRVIEARGGNAEATILGSTGKTSTTGAALLNALMIRVLDFNDIYWEQDPSHPSDLIPAALGPGEATGKNGRDLVTAIVLGYEFECRLCEAAIPGIRERGWHHASLTQFVSPLVAGKMMDLTAEQMAHAVGISGCHAHTLGSVTAGHLTMMKNTVDPMAVEAGVLAGHLAGVGYTGPAEIFEGKEGVEQCYGPRWSWEVLTEGLGESWRVTRCSMKAYPTEALTHSPISAALTLAREEEVTADQIEEVHVESISRAADILSDPSKYRVTSKESADHSLPYCLAVGLADGRITPASFEERRFTDPALVDLMQRVRVTAREDFERAFPEKKPARVVLSLKDGRQVEKQVDFPKGDPRNPMTDEELEEKFRGLTEKHYSKRKQDDVIRGIRSLEEAESVGEIMALLAVDSGGE
jgi:2-methylcitrate dehydratase